MTVTTLQTILLTALIAIWLVFNIVFLISVHPELYQRPQA